MTKKAVRAKKEPIRTRDGINYQEVYDHCLDSKLTVRAIAKYLSKSGITENECVAFCTAVGLVVNLTVARKVKAVAIEVWQQQRLHSGKDRWTSPSIPEELLDLP